MSDQLPTDPTPKEAPATDSSVLAGNVTQPFDEELYKKKVEFLEGILEERTTTDLTTHREVIIEAVGGDRKAKGVNVWELVKKQEASLAYREVTDILAEEAPNVTKPEEDKDVFDKIATSVKLDIRGTTDPNRVQAGPDVVNFAVGGELDGLIDTGELQDPAVLAKATETIRLLVAHGIYKLNQWGNADQLNTALSLLETYTEWVPDFNPKQAGFDEAKASLTMSLAALQVDQSSKPNYEYAKPARNYLFAQTADSLGQLRATEAHLFLRYQDIELPQPLNEQSEVD